MMGCTHPTRAARSNGRQCRSPKRRAFFILVPEREGRPMGIIMGLAFAGYIMAVLVPSLALGVLSLKNRNVNQKPRMWAIAFIVMVLILGGLSWYLVYPY